jgi:hypothetical protein
MTVFCASVRREGTDEMDRLRFATSCLEPEEGAVETPLAFVVPGTGRVVKRTLDELFVNS